MREPLKVIADILAFEMGLSPGQIMLAYENYEVPTSEGLYLVLSYVSSKAIGVTVTNVPTTSGMTEIQEASMDHTIRIDVMSFNDDARLRKEEVVLALNSNAAQRFMGDNLINVATLPSSFDDVSELEETKYLKRYTATIRVKSLTRKTKDADYYNQFKNPEVHINA